MRRSSIGFLAVGGLLLTACDAMGPTSFDEATLPADLRIAPPAADVPAAYAAFSGVWVGTWDDGMASKLAVQRVDAEGEVFTVYAWGDAPWGTAGGRTTAIGRIEGSTLRLEPLGNGARAAFERRDDGTLDGRFVRADGRVHTGVFFARDTS